MKRTVLKTYDKKTEKRQRAQLAHGAKTEKGKKKKTAQKPNYRLVAAKRARYDSAEEEPLADC